MPRLYHHALGVHDEALRRVADVVEGIAGNQRQQVRAGWREHAQIVGLDNPRLTHPIAEISVQRAHAQLVAHPNVLQRPEQTIPMRRKCTVPPLPRLGRIRQVPDTQVQRRGTVARHDGRRDRQTRNLQQPHNTNGTGRTRLRA
jgi:hypothetical protein